MTMLSCRRSITLDGYTDMDRCWPPLAEMSQLTQLWVGGGGGIGAPVLTTLHSLRGLTYNDNRLGMDEFAPSLLISSSAELVVPVIGPHHSYVCNTAILGMPIN